MRFTLVVDVVVVVDVDVDVDVEGVFLTNRVVVRVVCMRI